MSEQRIAFLNAVRRACVECDASVDENVDDGQFFWGVEDGEEWFVKFSDVSEAIADRKRPVPQPE